MFENRSTLTRFFATAGVAALIATACIVPEDASPREEFEIPIPEVLEPKRDADGDHYDLRQQEGLQTLLPNRPPSRILGYNAKWPGPTIVARANRPTYVTIHNDLNRRLTTHNHGLTVEARWDGHPADFVMPKTAKTYRYPNAQHASTYWYHDHTWLSTARNVWWGLAGLYIIKDDLWDSLNLPSGKYDVPLLLQDRMFEGPEGVGYLESPRKSAEDELDLFYPAVGGGAYGDVTCVNGVCSHPAPSTYGPFGPRMNVEARKYLFRLVNGSDHRIYRLALREYNPELVRDVFFTNFTIVAGDGSLLEAPVPKNTLMIGPAERYAMIVDFSRFKVGSTVIMENLDPPIVGRPMPFVMSFHVTEPAKEPDTSVIPTKMLTIPRFDPAKADVKRTIVLGKSDGDAVTFRQGFGGNNWTINERMYDPGRIDFQGKLGQTEVWDILNPTNNDHNIHLHLVQFQIISTNGAMPPPEATGWKDTVTVRARENAQIMLKWEGYPGVFVFHCHVIGHEDNAMMAQYEILP